MATQIDARVKQKTGTEADFAGYNLLDGEIALVRTSPGGPVWNFKVGPGNFDELDWSLQNPGAAVAADTSTVFPAGVPGLYIPTEDGTYNGVDVDLSVGYVQLIWDGTALVKVEFPIDLAGYATTQSLNATQSDVDIILADNYDIVTESPVKPIVPGGYINGATGGTVSYAGWNRTTATNQANMFTIDPLSRYYYSGEISADVANPSAYPVGVAYYDSGGTYLGYECRDVGTYSNHRLSPPAGAALMAACSYGSDPTITEEKLLPRLANTLYVDASNPSSGSGTVSDPFQTINQAISAIADRPTQYRNILIYEGDYRETLALADLPSGDYTIRGREGHRVRVLRSNKLTGWTKTAGRTNVYEVEYAGSIAAWATRANPIFEDGRPSELIADDKRHPLQRSLTHRLPFTPIYAVSDIDTVDSTPGTYCRIDGVLYIHTSDSDNPESNGYSYETITGQAANTFNDPAVTSKCVNLTMENIQFFYNPTGLVIAGFEKFVGINLVSLAGLGSGRIRPDTGITTLINCEAGFGDVDGFNGHFNRFTGYDSLDDNRSNSPITRYIGCWAHDNGDDGESSHEQHTVFMDGCLLEYNGDSGCRATFDATYVVKNTISRDNGWEVGSAGADRGEGFAAIGNPINTSRAGVRMLLMDCVSEGNNTGFGIASGGNNFVEAINCTSRNNTSAEYFAATGNMRLKNCKATNADPGKVKVTTGGTIVVENDVEVI